MDTTIENYCRFFADQVKEAEIEQSSILNAPMAQLFKKEELAIGYVDHINKERGHVIVKFHKNLAPRLKVLKSFVIITQVARQTLGEKPTNWICSFKNFCEEPRFHTKQSEMLPLYYTNTKDTFYDYVGCSGVSLSTFDIIERALSMGKSLTIVVFDPFPPVDYFNNLSNFMFTNLGNQELLTKSQISYEDWHPQELAYNPEDEKYISNVILNTLTESNCCILQGPPGTGKSYTIACIIEKYLSENKTVCATTMANKGLIELINQPPLQTVLSDGKISKSNLSADEKKQTPGLCIANSNLVVPEGNLLCCTNYVLSSVFSSEKLDVQLPHYDLVVIEEASQAFLATLVAFKSLGTKCLIVGDPMQLQPIVTNPRKSIYNSWNANTQIDGLVNYALGSNVPAYRIVTTFRLTPNSASLTGIFYGANFRSVQKKEVSFENIGSAYFPKGGGVLYCCTDSFTNQIYSDKSVSIIRSIVNQIEVSYSDRSVAIITPFKETVKYLQKCILTDNLKMDITVETIDRIQGMTVDYAILYVPARNPGFALDERRFNVATSRSRTTTLLISDVPLENLHSVQGKVRQFLGRCKRVKL